MDLTENDSMYIRMKELIELEEKRNQAIQTLEVHQKQFKKSFDRKVKVILFKEGDLVLKWDTNKEKLG